jgi:probable HAF family extracellular repeat protein
MRTSHPAHSGSRIALLVGAIVLGASIRPAAGQPAVTVVDLGSLGTSSFAHGVNDDGDVVGYFWLPPPENRAHAFLWRDGTMIDLGTLAGDTHAYAFDINNHTQIVGQSHRWDAANSSRPFLWQDGVMSALPLLPGHRWGWAYAINNLGEAVGVSEDRAVRWVSGIVLPLDHGDANFSEARGINDRGDIVGEAQRGATGAYPQAVIWESGIMRNLETPRRPDCPGGLCMLDLSSTASAINELGVIAGVAADADEISQAVRWAGGIGTALPWLPGGAGSEAAGINDAGDIAGYTIVVRDGRGFSVATLWREDEAWELPVPHPAFPHSHALAIGNRGHAAGSAGVAALTTHAMLWILEPEGEIDRTPPLITVTPAGEGTIWPPNGRLVPVTFAGTVTDEESGVATVLFRVEDEYRRVEPAGPIQLSGGRFALTVHLEASRRGSDRDGRRYVVHVTATDLAGNVGSAAAVAIVPHDRR